MSVGEPGIPTDAGALRHHHRRPKEERQGRRGRVPHRRPEGSEHLAHGRAEPARNAGLPGRLRRGDRPAGRARAARDGPRLAHGERPARRLRALPRVLPPRPAHPGRLPEGPRRRADQVRHRAARHRQQRRAQGQRARLDRGALGRQGRRQAPRPVQVRAQLGDRAPPRAGAGQLPARHPALLRGRRPRRDHLGGRRGRPLLPAGS